MIFDEDLTDYLALKQRVERLELKPMFLGSTITVMSWGNPKFAWSLEFSNNEVGFIFINDILDKLESDEVKTEVIQAIPKDDYEYFIGRRRKVVR